MRTDTQKEWTDAFRESFPEEVRPADGGWEAVAGRLRRAAARRRAAIAAAALALPLAGLLGVGVDCVSVKATTPERLGFVGREAGCEVWAVCLLEKA